MAKSYLDKDGLLYFLGKIRPSTTPVMDGTAATGTSKRFAAEDHVHPSDTSRAPVASPTLTGTPTAPTATSGTNNTQIATTAFVQTAISAVTAGVSDVKIGNTSIVTNGIASIPSGSANGLCPLNSSAKIDSTYLPSYVDDVIEARNNTDKTPLTSSWLRINGATPITPAAGIIYVIVGSCDDAGYDYSTSDYMSNQYRWGGTSYVKLSDGGVSSITNAEIDVIVAT